MKTVFILIGAKGSGKTYIGRLIEKNLGIKFLSTESIFLKIQRGREVSEKAFLKEGYNELEKEIDKYLKNNEKVIIESTGAFDFFKEFLSKLQSKYSVKLIFLYAPIKLCLRRIKMRCVKEHIKMSEEIIKNVFKITNSLQYNYTLKINTSKQKDENIINSFRKII